nr:hypothetical protein [Tanacetum cinerariifolium]
MTVVAIQAQDYHAPTNFTVHLPTTGFYAMKEALFFKGELVPVEQIMEWMEYTMLVVGVESTASWVSFNFKGLYGNEWALVVGTERGVHDQIRRGA